MKRFILSIMLGALILGGSVTPVSAWTDVHNFIWDGASWTADTGGGTSGVSNVSVTNLASTSNGLSVSLGTQVSSVAPKGATSVSGTYESITSTPASWTLTASATDFAIWNIGTNTVWIDFNGTGATVSAGLPLIASGTISRDAALGVVVWMIASTPTAIYRAEGRR